MTSTSERTSSSRALSSRAESEPERSSAGASAASSPRACSRASIQATFPSIVLISPLWQRSRNGWARSQLGSVFVEKRWWKIAHGDSPVRIAKVGVEARELGRGAERLVGDRAERERGDVDALDELRPPPGAVGPELRVVAARRRENELGDARHAGGGARAERGAVVRARRASRAARGDSARHASSTIPRSQGSRRKHIARPAPSTPVSDLCNGSSKPAPSPLTPSAAQAPRWATAASPARARSRSSREARPCASATRPMPQASRSRVGSWSAVVTAGAPAFRRSGRRGAAPVGCGG